MGSSSSCQISSRQGRLVAAMGGDGTAIVVREQSPCVVVIDPVAGKILKTLDIGTTRPTIAPVQSPDRKTVAIATRGMVFLVDLESGTIQKALPTGGSNPSMLSFSPDGKLLFSAATTARCWSGTWVAESGRSLSPARSARLKEQP